MFIPPVASARALAVGVYAHILREASALFARSTMMGNTGAFVCGTGNKYVPHAFFIYFIHSFDVEGPTRHTNYLFHSCHEIIMPNETVRALADACHCRDDLRSVASYQRGDLIT